MSPHSPVRGSRLLFHVSVSPPLSVTWLVDYTAALRDTTYGWCLRGAHSNCASAVFAFMYLHACRAWLFSAMSRVHATVWIAGLPVLLTLFTVLPSFGWIGCVPQVCCLRLALPLCFPPCVCLVGVGCAWTVCSRLSLRRC
jgi:quinol-cytochrome oxidoreductase complex cytochrome b subunit